MKTTLASLEKRLRRATGADPRLDRAIAAALDRERGDATVPPYTASVDECLGLIGRRLPDWHWHVGHGPMGVVPYASLTRGGDDAGAGHVEAVAPTVPLALLRALVGGLQAG